MARLLTKGADMSEQWDFLEDVACMLDRDGGHELGTGLPTILCDRVIGALSTEDRRAIDVSQAALERFYLGRIARMPQTAADAARGDGDPDSPEAGAFALGQIGMAHAIVARAASKRIDDAFEQRLRSPQFEQYIRILIEEELSGKAIADRLGKDEAVVSKRLKLLRQIGAVECRREGTRVVNFLTPAARAVVRARNMGAISVGSAAGRFSPEVDETLNNYRQTLPDQLRHSVVLVIGGDRRRAL